MKAVVEKLDGLKCRLKVTVPAEKADTVYAKRLKEVAKTIKLKGFRPGKAPADVVEKQAGKEVRQEVISQLIQDSFQEAVKEQNLQIAGTPVIDRAQEWKKGEPLNYEVAFETYPHIELKDLTGAKVERAVSEIAGADIDNMLDRIRKQRAEWVDVDRAAKDGDAVVIDFEGFVDDKPFQGGEAKEYQLELGSKQMIPGFEEGLVGVKTGDERDVKVTFPKDYGAQELAGKKAVFKTKTHHVKESKLPELNDEFAKQAGIEGGVDGLKQEVREKMQAELKQAQTQWLKDQVLNKLIELNKIDLPDSLVDDEIKRMQEMTKQQIASQQGTDKLPEIELPRDLYVKQAEKRVHLGLLFAEAIKKFSIELNKDLVRAKVEELAAQYPNSEEVVNWYYQNKQLLAEVEAVVLEQQAVDKLLEAATIKDKSMSYDDIIKAVKDKE